MSDFLGELAERIEARREELHGFVGEHLEQVEPPLYSSYDLRCNAHKAVVVDPNVYPAGFNNVCQESLKAAAPVLEQIIRKRFGSVATIGIYTEDHTKNKYYLQNLLSLLELFRDTGFESYLVTTNADLPEDPASLETAQRDEIELHRLEPDGTGLRAAGRSLDLIVSNNDFSAGVHDLLDHTDVPVTPPPEMGWWSRRKIDHFSHGHELTRSVADLLEVDPWRLIPATRVVDGVDFEEREGFDRVAEAIDEVVEAAAEKYDEHGIDETPCAFVKSNRGTYGMGVYRFESGEQFRDINRDTRDSMARVKGGAENDSVLVQEGVRTDDRVAGFVAEPVIYCLEHRPLGGFLRTNEEQSDRDNLNTRGMNFSSEDLCTLFVDDAEKNEGSNITQAKIEIYKLLATIGTLACGREIADLKAAAPASASSP